MAKQFVDVRDVMEVCDVSESKTYSILRTLNSELAERNFITIAGKVPKAFFEEKFYGMHITE